MVSSLFHPGPQPALHAWSQQRMCAMPREVVIGLMEGLAGYDLAGAFRGAGVPVRAINGDLWSTSVERNDHRSSFHLSLVPRFASLKPDEDSRYRIR